MLRPRIIPCLLISDGGLVKTVRFKDPKYVGDPINAVRIFNEKECDELIALDIDATREGREPDYDLIGHMASECRMPLCYGGGITTKEQAQKIIGLGVEKVAVSAAAINNASLVSEIAAELGSQSVVVVLDVKKTLFGQYDVWTENGRKKTSLSAIEAARRAEKLGAGEIVINLIDNDGVMKGYDLALARLIRKEVSLPLTFLGGAGSHDDIAKLISEVGTVGAAAGSLFVFKGTYRAVLINYPTPGERDAIIGGARR